MDLVIVAAVFGLGGFIAGSIWGQRLEKKAVASLVSKSQTVAATITAVTQRVQKFL